VQFREIFLERRHGPLSPARPPRDPTHREQLGASAATAVRDLVIVCFCCRSFVPSLAIAMSGLTSSGDEPLPRTQQRRTTVHARRRPREGPSSVVGGDSATVSPPLGPAGPTGCSGTPGESSARHPGRFNASTRRSGQR